MILSARAISWTWKRTVSNDSKTSVMIGPSATRRSRFSSMIRAL